MQLRGIALCCLCSVLSACVIGANWSPRVLGQRANTIILSDGQRLEHGSLPAVWQRRTRTPQSMQWEHRETKARIVAAIYCGRHYEDLPLPTLMGQLFAGIPLVQRESRTNMQLDGRAALRQGSLRRIDGVVVATDAVVYKKNECQIDAHVVGPRAHEDAMQADFAQFFRGLRLSAGDT